MWCMPDGVEQYAVFTGAGISGSAPASLPMGNALRNDVIRLLHDATLKIAPDLVGPLDLSDWQESSYKLEVVIGRLWGTIGDDALRCLLALSVAIPNEAHLLCALHLMAGGTHVTLNFDNGVERAYALLVGDIQLPEDAPLVFADLLPQWRALVPANRRNLRVAASRREFDEWVADGRPPALLKVHGSLTPDGQSLVDVVVVDIEELAALWPARREAIDSLAAASQLLITGYAGADSDVYGPLLAAAGATRTTWRTYSLNVRSPVPNDTRERGIALFTGKPSGTAVAGMRGLLALNNPDWPAIAYEEDAYARGFHIWQSDIMRWHSRESLVEAWAWLVADTGDLNTAVALLHRVLGASPEPRALMRYAEVLYMTNGRDERLRAAHTFRRLALARASPLSVRTHALLRMGDAARGRAAARDTSLARRMFNAGEAFTVPLAVLALTRGGRADKDGAADAYRALQQTLLRLCLAAACRAPIAVWPLLGSACGAVALLGRRAERTAVNGNRLALIRNHRLLLVELQHLFTHRPCPRGTREQLSALRDAYRYGDDPAGAANCSAALAIVSAAEHDLAAARVELREAERGYAASRVDGVAPLAGEVLLSNLRAILARLKVA